jgi:diaminohydroxyphosphoribosylaminopyrimidine deaminase/5-amino-6-(5-phosphoribosylamino)uracil reductase
MPIHDTANAMNFTASIDEWHSIPALFRTPCAVLPRPWADVFGPLLQGQVDDLVVVAQMGQSIDGRIATESGHSKYINGAAGLDHLHRLRAVVDAVVVGVGTAVADDPQLTVRRVAGPNPARIVIDPRGRLSASARMLADDGVRRIVVVGSHAQPTLPHGIEVLRLDLTTGRAPPHEILAALAAAGLRRILIEGGAQTVSGFLAAGCLDRLHIVVAPMLLGAGQPSIALPPVKLASDALRPPVRAHLLSDEVLFDIDLSAHRVPIGRAKTSR